MDETVTPASRSFNGAPCAVLGREYSDRGPFVRIRLVDGVEKRVRAWDVEPKMTIYAAGEPRKSTRPPGECPW